MLYKEQDNKFLKQSLPISGVVLLVILLIVIHSIVYAGSTINNEYKLFLPIISKAWQPDNLWQEFFFRDPGTLAQGCASVDFCLPSPSGNSEFAPDPPWVFTAPVEGVNLIVVDVADSGDVFNIYDYGVFVGTTSKPTVDHYCGLDPEICLLDNNMSSGSFLLGEGPHEITIFLKQTEFSAGVGYFLVSMGNLDN